MDLKNLTTFKILIDLTTVIAFDATIELLRALTCYYGWTLFGEVCGATDNLHPVIGEVNHWPREQQLRMDSTLGVQGSRGEHDRSKALRVFQRSPDKIYPPLMPPEA